LVACATAPCLARAALRNPTAALLPANPRQPASRATAARALSSSDGARHKCASGVAAGVAAGTTAGITADVAGGNAGGIPAGSAARELVASPDTQALGT